MVDVFPHHPVRLQVDGAVAGVEASRDVVGGFDIHADAVCVVRDEPSGQAVQQVCGYAAPPVLRPDGAGSVPLRANSGSLHSAPAPESHPIAQNRARWGPRSQASREKARGRSGRDDTLLS